MNNDTDDGGQNSFEKIVNKDEKGKYYRTNLKMCGKFGM